MLPRKLRRVSCCLSDHWISRMFICTGHTDAFRIIQRCMVVDAAAGATFCMTRIAQATLTASMLRQQLHLPHAAIASRGGFLPWRSVGGAMSMKTLE